nr:phosphatidylinositol phosphatase PTPRQ-like isoform X2 [Procambarus clarkii]
MLCWSVLLLCIKLLAAAAQDSEELQKEYQERFSPRVDGEGPPENVTVIGASTTSLLVSWDPPPLTPEHYVVDIFGGISEVVYDTSYVVEGLQVCTSYIVTVTSYYRDTQYPGPLTQGITQSSVPPQPQDCKISKPVKGTVQVQWKDPNFECSVTNHSIVWTWDVLWSDEEGSVETFTTFNQYTLSDVTPYSNVTAEISAGNDGGFSTSLNCSLVTSQDKPGAPVIVNTASYEAGSATLTWTPPVDANGIILNYNITSKSEERSTGTVVDGTVLTTVFEDLHECKMYSFSVAARTVVGYGPESEESSVFISGNVPPPPPQDCEISEQVKGTVQVQWKDPDFECSVTNHSIVWTWDVLWSDEEGSVETFTTSNQYTLSDVTPYSNVTAEISAGNNVGFSTSLTCSLVTSQDKPGAPVIVNTTSYEVGSVTLTWTPPVDANGIILNYKITSKSEEGSTETVVDGTVLTTVIEDLHQCESYNFSVAARTVVGYGPESEESSVFISGNVLPPPPQDCEISEQEKGTVQVQWKDPDFACGITNHSVVWTWDVLWTDEEGSVEVFTTSNHDTLYDVQFYTNVTAEIRAATYGGLSTPLFCWVVTSPDKMFDVESKADE